MPNHARNATVHRYCSKYTHCLPVLPADGGGAAGGDDPGLVVRLHRLVGVGHPVHDGQGAILI